MQNINVEFLNTDPKKFIPVNLLKTNYGFGSKNPNIEVLNTSSQQLNRLSIDFPINTSAIVMLINPETKKVVKAETLLPTETRIRLEYKGSYWIYVITKEFDDGFVNQQGIVEKEVDETNRMLTREDLVTLRLNETGALTRSVSDSEESRQWYNFTGTYSGPLIWQMPEGGLSVNLGELANELDRLGEAKAYLLELYSRINLEFEKFGSSFPTFVETEERAKDKSVVVHKVIDSFIQSTWKLNKDDTFWDDLNIDYTNSYIGEIWTRFKNEYKSIGLFENELGSLTYVKNYTDYLDTYGFLMDRLDTGGQGEIDGYSTKRTSFMYAEAQVSFSNNPFSWTDVDVTKWIPQNILYPQTDFGQKNFDTIKYEVQNPLIEGWRLKDGGEGHDPILMSVFRKGGEIILNLIDGPDENTNGLMQTSQNTLVTVGIGTTVGNTLNSVNTWWSSIINKATSWFANVYGNQNSKGWIFSELDRIESLITEKRTAFALSFNDQQNSNGDQQLGFNAIMQNITFLKNLMGYLDDNLWSTLIKTNTDMLNKLLEIEESISTDVSTNTILNITGAKVNLSDIEILYRRLDDSNWHSHSAVYDLSEEIKMIDINQDYFRTVGKYVIVVRPKQIEVDVNTIGDNNIITVYDQLNNNQTKNYYYGWNIQFRDPLGEIKGQEKIIVGSYWNIEGQHLQISPIIDGEVLTIESNIKATIWNNAFSPVMITLNVVEYNNLTNSYYLYAKKELNNSSGECIIYDYMGNVYKRQSFGTYATDQSDKDIIDFRLPITTSG